MSNSRAAAVSSQLRATSLNTIRELVESAKTGQAVISLIESIQDQILSGLYGNTSLQTYPDLRAEINFNNEGLMEQRWLDIATDGSNAPYFEWLIQMGAVPGNQFLDHVIVAVLTDREDARQLVKIFFSYFPDESIVFETSNLEDQLEEARDEELAPGEINDYINDTNNFLNTFGYELVPRDLKHLILGKIRTGKRRLTSPGRENVQRRRFDNDMQY